MRAEMQRIKPSTVTDCLLLKHIEGIRDVGSNRDKNKSLRQGTFQPQMYGHSCEKAQIHGTAPPELKSPGYSGPPGSVHAAASDPCWEEMGTAEGHF